MSTKIQYKNHIKDTFTQNSSYSDLKKKNSRTCTPNNQNLGGPIPKVKNKNLQKPRYTWRCAVDRSVLALLGGEGGEG